MDWDFRKVEELEKMTGGRGGRKTATPGRMKKRKRKLPGSSSSSQMPISYSTGEEEEKEELESFDSASDHEDHFNVASMRMEGRKKVRHVANEPGKIVGTFKNRAMLQVDAKAIHDVLGKGHFSGSTTVVCAVFEVKGGYLYVATVNDALMAPSLRSKAEELDYSVIYGVKSHAEANMILYEHKHLKDARLLAFGCDKASCPECEDLMRRYLPEGLDITPKPHKADGSRAFTPNYYFESKLTSPKGDQGPFVQDMRGFIHRNYGEDGSKLPHAGGV